MTTKEKISMSGKVVAIVGGFGASMLVGAVAGPVIAPMAIAAKVVATIGMAGLGGIAGDAVANYYVKQFDDIADGVEIISDKISEIKQNKVNKETEA